MNRYTLTAARSILVRRKLATPVSLSMIPTTLNSVLPTEIRPSYNRTFASSWSTGEDQDRPVWSEEWKALGLGAKLVNSPQFPKTLMFVQVGFGVDQHGADDATKAATRAVRNAIEFNSIPGIIEHIPGGRKEMLIHVKLGVPKGEEIDVLPVDVLQVAKVFPYGKLLPIVVIPGGLDFSTGRVVEELGDTHDRAVCVVACISIGYGTPEKDGDLHTTYNTQDGF